MCLALLFMMQRMSDDSIVYLCGWWDAEHQVELDASCEEDFHCENSGGCIDPSQVCNFHTDCPLGEDEGFICGEV